MARKPHPQSVTAKPCVCGYLESTAAEPNGLILFDDRMGEYQLRRPDGTGAGPIYHCLFCGGAAPKSKRATLFARVTWAETSRLKRLTRGISSVQQALERLGPPKQDLAEGLTIQTPGSDTQAPTTTSYRVVRWDKLSDTADVDLIDYGVRGIKFTFVGKYLGDQNSAV